MNDFISASHDVVFKALFVRNQDVLKAFLNDSLDLNLTDADSIKVMSSEDVPDAANGKLSRFDVHVRTANRRYNVEMQAQKSGFSSERVLYYWSKLYGTALNRGANTKNLIRRILSTFLDSIISTAKSIVLLFPYLKTNVTNC